MMMIDERSNEPHRAMETNGPDPHSDCGEFPAPISGGNRGHSAQAAESAGNVPFGANCAVRAVSGQNTGGAIFPARTGEEALAGFRVLDPRPIWQTPRISDGGVITLEEFQARTDGLPVMPPGEMIAAPPSELPRCFGREPFLLSARHDLLVEADRHAERCRAYPGWGVGDALNVSVVASQFEFMAQMIDKLAAYLKGADDRLIAAGQTVDGLRNDVRQAESAFEAEQTKRVVGEKIEKDLRKLIGDAAAAVRLVENISTMTDMEAEFVTGYEIRDAARAALGNETPATLPRFYDENDRNRAIDAFRQLGSGGGSHGFCSADIAGRIVDKIAEALGVRRAGA